MNDVLTSILFLLVIGVIGGYFIGYLIKRISGMAITLGFFAFLLLTLTYIRAIDLNLDAIGAMMTQLADVLGRLGFTALVSSTPFVGSFIVGLIMGIKKN